MNAYRPGRNAQQAVGRTRDYWSPLTRMTLRVIGAGRGPILYDSIVSRYAVCQPQAPDP